jgi:hypothetical protein
MATLPGESFPNKSVPQPWAAPIPSALKNQPGLPIGASHHYDEPVMKSIPSWGNLVPGSGIQAASLLSQIYQKKYQWKQ